MSLFHRLRRGTLFGALAVVGLLTGTVLPASAQMDSFPAPVLGTVGSGIHSQAVVPAFLPPLPGYNELIKANDPCLVVSAMTFEGTFEGMIEIGGVPYTGLVTAQVSTDPGKAWYEGGGVGGAPNGTASGDRPLDLSSTDPNKKCLAPAAAPNNHAPITPHQEQGVWLGFNLTLEGASASGVLTCTYTQDGSGKSSSYDRDGTDGVGNEGISRYKMTFTGAECALIPPGAAPIFQTGTLEIDVISTTLLIGLSNGCLKFPSPTASCV
ncbi:MAG TPA: hypothetical protein VNA57_02695 [Acidimicrobiales bacterium]|nr:hypothetical protein [Acidimicrobiales bacterium]